MARSTSDAEMRSGSPPPRSNLLLWVVPSVLYSQYGTTSNIIYNALLSRCLAFAAATEELRFLSLDRVFPSGSRPPESSRVSLG